MNRWHAFSQLILSRMREFYREPETIFWVYGFPLILALGLFIAFSRGEPIPPKVDIQGNPADARVESLAKLLRAEKMEVGIHDADECRRRLRQGKTALVIVAAPSATPEYVYDKAQSESVLARHWVEEVLLRARTGAAPATDVFVSEPGSRYIDFLLPGLMGMNIMGGGLFGVGFVLVDMRVRKLFKRLLATPMNRRDFLLSILTARLMFLFPEMLALLLTGYWVFGVPIKGGIPLLVLVILMGAMAFASLGLLVGSRTEKTETASGLINVVMLPMYLLSGVFFSSRRFPEAIQPFVQALPLTQLNDSLREVMLEGQSFGDIAWRLGILAIWIGVCFPLALKWFRWR